jgi:hypothetical protein
MPNARISMLITRADVPGRGGERGIGFPWLLQHWRMLQNLITTDYPRRAQTVTCAQQTRTESLHWRLAPHPTTSRPFLSGKGHHPQCQGHLIDTTPHHRPQRTQVPWLSPDNDLTRDISAEPPASQVQTDTHAQSFAKHPPDLLYLE